MTKTSPRSYVRFSLADRLQHIVMLLSFTTLGFTGLVQKYSLNVFSLTIINMVGGVENLRAAHHIAATFLMLVSIYHLIAFGYRFYVLRERVTMLPSFQDAKDALAAFLYNIGLGKARPQMGRYTFEEKAEYWALVWGTIVMGLTGFMMWNPLATVKIFPGDFIPAAKAAHGAEAVLAVLAIIVWHMYGVHLKAFNKSMWTGKITEEEMLHEHPLELADIKAGVSRATNETLLRKRKAIYYPVAGVTGLLMLLAVYGFVNGEQTAIITVPARTATVMVYAPETPTPLPPTSTPRPTRTPRATMLPGTPEPLIWDTVATIFDDKCGLCHAESAKGGLNLNTFADAMKGGTSGPVIVPKDAANSKLVAIQVAGGHAGQLSAEELKVIEDWINAGAPEK